MKPLPDVNDEAAMILRGKRSAIGAARKEAVETLRDMLTFMQSDQWNRAHVEAANKATERLLTLQAMWEELK